jgi:hypothetical protein
MDLLGIPLAATTDRSGRRAADVTNVFVLTRPDWDYTDILGVFATVEAAHAALPEVEWTDDHSGRVSADPQADNFIIEVHPLQGQPS